MKILYINDTLADNSGIASVMMNYYELLKNKIDFNFFIIHHYEKNNYFKLINEGIKVFCPNIVPKPQNYIMIRKSLSKILCKNQYDIIEIHCPQYSFLFMDICKKYNIGVRIIHAHSSMFSKSRLKSIVGMSLNYYSLKNSEYYFSCSDLATKYWFKKNKNVMFVPNVINVSNNKMLSRLEKETLKKKLKISPNQNVIGFVGRLSKEKNIKFILKIIEKLNNEKNIIFLFVGNGKLYDYIIKYAQKKKIEDRIVMTGYCQNVFDYYQIMDILILPSKKEGLPVAALEAQFYDVECIIADTITKQIDLGLVSFEKLNCKDWIKRIDQIMGKKEKNVINKNNMFFNREMAAEYLYSNYCKMLKNG